MRKKITIKRLKNTDFPLLYSEFMTHNNQSTQQFFTMLSIAVVFINSEDELIKRLGYRIVVEYCNKTSDYKPLYEIAINYGLYPISEFIERHYLLDNERSFFTEWNDAFSELYKHDSIYLTNQQALLKQFADDSSNRSAAIIAPTSYGKTEQIMDLIRKYKGKKICIVTPNKALLTQTKYRIKQAGVLECDEHIIIHPEMYRTESDAVIAVFTQERLLRLLKTNPSLYFDCIIIDEAHELLEGGIRGSILSTAIIIAQKRNLNTAFKFLTPFVANESNLRLKYSAWDYETFRVTEYIKTEKYFLHDLNIRKNSFFYDQFINDFYPVPNSVDLSDDISCLISQSTKKNIVYLNKPVVIEEVAIKLANQLPLVDSPAIERAIKHLEDYLQPQYNLITCLKKGVIYHHASVPDSVRLFIEELYKKETSIRFLVTSSTLLSGVNLPAERMFLLDNKKGMGNLSPDHFKNLIGRVCRFSEIFNIESGDLRLLQPEVHFVFGRYYSKATNIDNFIRSVARADIKLKDKLENVLLENTEITSDNKTELKEAAEFIENYEPGSITNYSERYTATDIGKACIMNGIREIDVFTNEQIMQAELKEILGDSVIDNSALLLKTIQACFIKYVKEQKHNFDLRRLLNNEALIFYAMLIDWRLENKPYSQMIQLYLNYWRKLLKKDREAHVYVGRWGEVAIKGRFEKNYVVLKNLDRSKAVNLAIVRIKEEEDFIDNKLMKYVEALNDVNALDPSFYLKVKYGTEDKNAIALLRNGLSLNTAVLLLEKYKHFVHIDSVTEYAQIDEQIVEKMKDNNENQIIIFEVENYF